MDNIEATFTLKAFRMAIGIGKRTEHFLIHYSDRGLQYCSKLYTG